MKKLSFNDMLRGLETALKEKTVQISSAVSAFFHGNPQYILFLSATDEKQRSYVVTARENTYQNAWKNVVQQLKKLLLMAKINPLYLKADLVTSIETVPFPEYVSGLAKLPKNDFRKGIAFDKLFKYAFLEQEVNANVFFNQWENGGINVATQHIADYCQTHRKTAFQINFRQLTEMYLFDTVGLFHDGMKVYPLQSELDNNGSRFIDISNRAEINFISATATDYLMKQQEENGKFHYVRFPAFHKGLQIYNIIYHVSTIHALLEMYRVSKIANLLVVIEKAIEYVINEALIEVEMNGDSVAFILETSEVREIKLGANALMIITLANYAQITGNATYAKLLVSLTNGLLAMQQTNGQFHHVLHEDLSLKEQFRTPFFHGEAILALVSAFQVTSERKWLMAAERSLRYAIKHDYWKNGDPFLNEAAELLYRIRPHITYADFNLQCTIQQLNKAFTTQSEAPLLLRLLLSTERLIAYLKEVNKQPETLERISESKLKRAIAFRVKHQLNSFFWPEKAMYFSKPREITGAFYVRHDSFRIQINDVANQLISLLYYSDRVDKIIVTSEYDKEATLLLHAKRLEKQGKSAMAISIMEKDLIKQEVWLDNTYALLAKLYRESGEVEKTKEILGKGNSFYPQSEVILVEFLNLCMTIQNWHAAQVVVEDLLKINSKEGKYYLELGRALAETKDIDKAKVAFKIGLIHHHHLSTEQLLEKIQSTLPKQSKKIDSIYTYLGGMNNLGAMLHETGDTTYFTKITRIDEGAKREKLFYQKLQTTFHNLKMITPSFQSVEAFDDVQYLTIEHIAKSVDSLKINAIIETIKEIGKIPYEELIRQFPNPIYPFIMRKNTGPDIIYLFTKIHKKEHNDLIYKTVKLFAEEYGYPKEVIDMVEQIYQHVLTYELYNEIRPKADYSLVHADLKLNNLIKEQETDQIYVFDWGSFTIGPRFSDMALLFANMPISFNQIIEMYLEKASLSLSKAEKFYFCYAYFLASFTKITKTNINSIYKRNLIPAMDYLNKVVMA